MTALPGSGPEPIVLTSTSEELPEKVQQIQEQEMSLNELDGTGQVKKDCHNFPLIFQDFVVGGLGHNIHA